LRNKLLSAALVIGAVIAFAGTPSGAASHSATTKSSSSRVDAYWFSTTNNIPGGAQWSYSVSRPRHPSASSGTASEGTIEFSGPNNATIFFTMAPDFRALADGHTGSTGLSHVMANFVENTEGLKVDYGPTQTTLGNASSPALLVNGTNSYGNDFVQVIGDNPKNNSYVKVLLTCPPADYADDEQVMQALDTSFRYEH
jgi:hypothetical protein